MKYLSIDGIKQAFAEHLMKYRGYSNEEAEMAVSDFPDPYTLPYLSEDFIEHNVEIDGVLYEMNASYTSLWRVGITGIPEFRFYTYYCEEDITNHTVGEYMKARKLFRTEDIDPSDFPQ